MYLHMYACSAAFMTFNPLPSVDARRRLLDAAKALADATSKMVEAAKVAARNPQDEAAQEALRKAAEHLR